MRTTFAQTRVVIDVVFDEPAPAYAATSVGACVLGEYRAIRIDPFEGRGTISVHTSVVVPAR